MKHFMILALTLSASVACSDEQLTPVVTESADSAPVPPLRFPSLEAFEYLNGWEAISAEGKREREVDLLRRIDEMTEDYGDPAAATSAPPGSLNPRPRACQLLPGSMQMLGTRSNSSDWTAEDRELTNRIARLAQYIDASSNFDFDSEERPNAELQRLVDWFEAQAADPKTLGLMVSSRYSGPWYPRDASTELELSVNSSKSLPGGLELELGYRDDGTWCMRGRTDSVVRWVKDLGMPADQAVSFADEEAVDLGPYGWRLRVTFGGDASLYVSKAGEALFYFTSH